MGEEDCNSAQCAWLFGHAHLTGETHIEFKYGIQIHFPALSFVRAATVETFFVPRDPFLTGFVTGLDFAGFLVVVVFFTALLALGADLRCCLARSSRNNSSS